MPTSGARSKFGSNTAKHRVEVDQKGMGRMVANSRKRSRDAPLQPHKGKGFASPSTSMAVTNASLGRPVIEENMFAPSRDAMATIPRVSAPKGAPEAQQQS